MDAYIQEKPPWKHVEWIKSPFWQTVPDIAYVDWILDPNEAATKSKEEIRDLDKEHKWELAKKMVNPYELVYTHDDDRLPPSLSLEFPLSRSFFKMVEILNVSGFFETTVKTVNNIRSVHVAEGPGGFIQALYNRAALRSKTIAASFAMTLKPNNPHVPGWKKATQFLQKHKQVKIHYGADGTGDIYNVANQDSFIQFSSPKAHLFTADGGFDFSVDYALQEQHVFHLLICSITIGLRTLAKGGQFVLKIFDCTSPNTKTLILILSRCFADWTLYKPAMTRPCNSERYFIGRDFRGSNADSILKSLLEIQECSAKAMYPILSKELLSEIPFLDKHIDSTTTLQVTAIKLAISLIHNPEDWWKNWYLKCLKKSSIWCETFRVPSIPDMNHMAATRLRFPDYFMH
jgi:23S rRNA U2552 (ribose-2'-O)-methylase RlmE/FtsJ